MTAGVGIQIVSPTGTGPQGGPEQVIFTTKYPFAKLDTQLGVDTSVNPPKGPVSFQNISIFFNTNPPFSAGTTVTTLVYKFPHGYTYVPVWWVLFQNNGASNDSKQWTYGNEGSILVANSPTTFSQLLVKVDSTNVNFYIAQAWGTITDIPPFIVGFTIKLRVYIFTDPVVVG